MESLEIPSIEESPNVCRHPNAERRETDERVTVTCPDCPAEASAAQVPEMITEVRLQPWVTS